MRRNRQVFAFYDTIKWFQPSFVLMENVLDIFKKGDGEYAKLAASILLDMDYQTRTGVIAACHHGASQGRWRCAAVLNACLCMSYQHHWAAEGRPPPSNVRHVSECAAGCLANTSATNTALRAVARWGPQLCICLVM